MARKIFVIADTKFNVKECLQERGFDNVVDMNEMLIEKWNSVVSDGDLVCVFGVFGTKSGSTMRAIIERLNGNIYMMDYPLNSTIKKSRWKFYGIKKVWDTTIKFAPVAADKVICIGRIRDNTSGYYCVSEDFFGNNPQTVWQKDTLCISAKFWDYTPIIWRSIMTIIKNMEDLDSAFEQLSEVTKN